MAKQYFSFGSKPMFRYRPSPKIIFSFSVLLLQLGANGIFLFWLTIFSKGYTHLPGGRDITHVQSKVLPSFNFSELSEAQTSSFCQPLPPAAAVSAVVPPGGGSHTVVPLFTGFRSE